MPYDAVITRNISTINIKNDLITAIEHQGWSPWCTASLTVGGNLPTYRSLWRIWAPLVTELFFGTTTGWWHQQLLVKSVTKAARSLASRLSTKECDYPHKKVYTEIQTSCDLPKAPEEVPLGAAHVLSALGSSPGKSVANPSNPWLPASHTITCQKPTRNGRTTPGEHNNNPAQINHHRRGTPVALIFTETLRHRQMW